jgi:hypothetical protein
MTAKSQPLVKNPTLDPVQDFYLLRREGIGFIEQTGKDRWTDYNVHDPGITILEALCYAITDIGYRIGWDMPDILSPEVPQPLNAPPYPGQAFFTAREILTVNPTTSDDLRRLLIDLADVRDAWVICKACACEVSYFAWCDNDRLQLAYGAPAAEAATAKEVWALGLYETLIELEPDPELGDLNDRMIVSSTVYHDAAGGAHPVIMELRFPDLSLRDREQWQRFTADDAAPADVTLTHLGATKDFDVFDRIRMETNRDAYIRNNWSTVFYVSFEVAGTITIANATLRVSGDAAVKAAATAEGWRTLLQDKEAGGFIARYREKARRTRRAVDSARACLQAHRSLDEDQCIVSGVGVEQVAVCADVEVEPDADIERVQAEIWFRIEQYFSPPVLFRTLQELRDGGMGVEDIFNGPKLDNGFISDADLKAAAFKTVLRGSDIIDSLMNIPGVVAVNNLRLTKFDAEGNPVQGVADPSWTAAEGLKFDPTRVSAAWMLYIAARHQPRLYLSQSRFLFFKNGLPFRARADEATDTLSQLRGEAERPKDPGAEKDLPIPRGEYRNPDDCSPIQYSLPTVYGVRREGLPSHASLARRAQASNLKAYLMVFEQLIGNALAQLAHTADLFSLNPEKRTYFAKAFDEAVIDGFHIIAPSMDVSAVEALIENQPEFQERRNRFLDHLLARFGEQFADYALLLTDELGTKVALSRLIEDKTAFLKRYPTVSHDRFKAFDYTREPCLPGNQPGLKKRINLLLGYPDLRFCWEVGPQAGSTFPVKVSLLDGNDKHWLDGSLAVTAADPAAAKYAAYRTLIERMIVTDAYDPKVADDPLSLVLRDGAGVELARCPEPFTTLADAHQLRDELVSWSASERTIIVEHLLLRPKFIGDALYPACCDDGCSATCGAEDPYSFRLTFVMPGWSPRYSRDMDLRRFADRTIRQETPSHLLGKACWVGNDGFVENPCAEIVTDLADLLASEGVTDSGAHPETEEACACANAIYHAFSIVFGPWYEPQKFTFDHAEALKDLIAALFQTVPRPGAADCTTILSDPLWKKVQDMMTAHFVDVALNGWQFERFEWAWCNWLEANKAFDWTSEALSERVEAILAANLASTPPQPTTLCAYARTIVTDYGIFFHDWLAARIREGAVAGTLPEFTPPEITLRDGFGPGTREAIAALLGDRYRAYRHVSYWLWVVVTLLSGLGNIYPGATLHDCDDGSDHNPVRLDNTALGNYPHRPKLT